MKCFPREPIESWRWQHICSRGRAMPVSRSTILQRRLAYRRPTSFIISPRKKHCILLSSACDEFKTELECLKNHERDVALGLKQVACQHLMRLLSNPDPARLVLREVFKGESGIDSSQVAKILHRNFALLVEQIERGQVSGQFRRDTDPAMVAVTLIAQNIFFFQSWEILRQFPEFQNLDCAERLSAAAFDSLSKGLFAK